MKKPLLIIFGLFIAGQGLGQGFFDASQTFLDNYVEDGGVKYSLVSKDQMMLESLVEQIASYSLSDKSSSEQLAFYINAYNILVIKGIIESYPVKSPMDIGGFFDKKKYKVAGKNLTLNGIENDVVRPTFKDARIHFALVCAALGCPQISSSAYRPETLDKQLDDATKTAMNRDYFIRVDEPSKKVDVSQIFNWYKVDFGGASGVLPYVNKYRDSIIPDDFQVGFYEYDWSLNEKK